MTLEITKGIDIPYNLRKILVVGVEKSGKTSFIATMPKPILVFCGESNSESRLAGQKDIDFVRCYDTAEELSKNLRSAGFRRFEKNFKELLTMNPNDVPYKTIAIDPLSFISDYLVAQVDRENPGMKGGANTYGFWGLIKDRHTYLLAQVIGLTQYVVVTSHVRLTEDETTGASSFLPDVNGSIRDSLGGFFNGVFFTKTVGGKYTLQVMPEAGKKCGMTVPLGMETKIGREVPPDFNEIMKLVTLPAK